MCFVRCRFEQSSPQRTQSVFKKSEVHHSIFLGVNEGLLGDENSIQELTLILLSNFADLVDFSGGKGDSGVVVSFEEELSLLNLGSGDFGSTNHLHELGLLATQEVLDLDGLAGLGNINVDGEMSVHESHFVQVALEVTMTAIIIKNLNIPKESENQRCTVRAS